MTRFLRSILILAPALSVCAAALAGHPAAITVDYPIADSVFPPDFASPTFVWHDAAPSAILWTIDAAASAGNPALHAVARGERPRIGEIDARTVSATNQPPQLTPAETTAHTWKPDAAQWIAIRRRARVTLTITGYSDAARRHAVSKGEVTLQISPDPVGAPIFYRDVPLMPSETEAGVIKPLATNAVPLIAWRLRDVSQTASRVVMEGVHSCSNCHSFSRDGKTMGIDVDGPLNDKGLYAIVPVEPRTAITRDRVVEWSTFQGKLGGKLRAGFMSQVSPDGNSVITMIHDSGVEQSDYQRRRRPADLVSSYYVANFKDYRFLQVFYPTRGILAWYNRASGRLEPLPGADDPKYVHTSAAWSPDGKYIVFARAEARDAYLPGTPPAESANDARETPIQYDLYRIPFHDGGGGVAEPIAGASRNGMSNSFPKVSPDGKWIVYVQARNGLLMRPDSRLFIVPFQGGEARLMRANTALMNSWHSFSPNGRWLVFSSKSRSPYTQMFLTHIDEQGNDTPAILIENSTAGNRAVNLPEFVNIAPGGMDRIDNVVSDYYRVVDEAAEVAKKGTPDAAVAAWTAALSAGETALVHFNLANALIAAHRTPDAIKHFEQALRLSPDHSEAHNNLGRALLSQGQLGPAATHFEAALAGNPENASAHSNLGITLAQQGRAEEAMGHLEMAVKLSPEGVDERNNLGLFLMMTGRPELAVPHLEVAARSSGASDPLILDLLARAYAAVSKFDQAITTARRALTLAQQRNQRSLTLAIESALTAYESGKRPAQ